MADYTFLPWARRGLAGRTPPVALDAAAARPGHGRRRRDPDRHPRVAVHAHRQRAGRRHGAGPASRRPHRPAAAQRRRRAELPAARSSSTRRTCPGCSRRPRAARTTGCGRGACSSSSTSAVVEPPQAEPGLPLPVLEVPGPPRRHRAARPGRVLGVGAYAGGRARRRGPRRGAGRPAGDERVAAARPAAAATRTAVCGLPRPRLRRRGRPRARRRARTRAGRSARRGRSPAAATSRCRSTTHWEFATGSVVGDFEQLARRLRPFAGSGGRRRRADVHRRGRSRAAGQGRRRPRRIPRHGRGAARLAGQQRTAGRGARRRHAPRSRRPLDAAGDQVTSGPDGDDSRPRPAALRRLAGAPAHRAGRPAALAARAQPRPEVAGPRPGSAPSWSGRTRRSSSSGAGSRCRRSSTRTSCSAGPGCRWRR